MTLAVQRRPRRAAQTLLFEAETPITPAGARVVIGDFFEELTALALRGERLRCDSRRAICPDVRLAPGHFVEVKSAGQSGAAIVYEKRRAKDRAVVAGGDRLDYAVWGHAFTLRSLPELTLGRLRDALALTVRSLTLIAAAELDRALDDVKLQELTLRPGGGWGSVKYCALRSVRLRALRGDASAAPGQGVEVYGRRVDGFVIYDVR